MYNHIDYLGKSTIDLWAHFPSTWSCKDHQISQHSGESKCKKIFIQTLYKHDHRNASSHLGSALYCSFTSTGSSSLEKRHKKVGSFCILTAVLPSLASVWNSRYSLSCWWMNALELCFGASQVSLWRNRASKPALMLISHFPFHAIVVFICLVPLYAVFPEACSRQLNNKIKEKLKSVTINKSNT